jgi:hypothetical protein
MMNRQHSPAATYQQEKERHAAQLDRLKRRHSFYGWLRLGIILLTAGVAFYLFSFSLVGGWAAIVLGVAIFLVLVSGDTDISKEITTIKHLLELNEEELKILADDYLHRIDGSDFAPGEHDYAGDLDILGRASLYQYINRCYSEQGRRRLVDNFLYGLPVAEVQERQQAVEELAFQYQWRQGLEVRARQIPVTLQTEKDTALWLGLKEEHFTGRSWKYIVPLYSVFSLASAVAAIMGLLPAGLFGPLFLGYFIFSGSLSKRALQSYVYLNGIVKEVETIGQLIRWIEEKEFSTPFLQRLQQSVKVESTYAHVQIRELKDILNRFDLRGNALVFIFLNSFLLWDARQMMALNRWREKNRRQVGQWFYLIGEFEVLNSLATLRFNQPGWCWPSFSHSHFTFRGEGIGHPLIPEGRRVTNNLAVSGTGKVALVTGSNMAGKSTFLRSLGVNTLLAQMGAPVCAKRLEVSPVRLMTSMRIADNLAENTSTFYAELKKLKTIIEAIRRQEPVWVVLDEVLRGTNSMDRHIGLKALIRQIINHGAVAVIATHDVEVAALADDLPGSIENYHFDVQVEGEELYFDYKLKEGVCASLNASILMRKIGIELE